ncbi:hypothetical protein ACA910_013238 [Epithemia clementina (nom. ined.)]
MSDTNFINGYDDPAILAGAGTVGIEMVDNVPNVNVVLVTVGGAGLIAGISCAVKTLKTETKFIGVEPAFCTFYTAALKAGRRVPTKGIALAVLRLLEHEKYVVEGGAAAGLAALLAGGPLDCPEMKKKTIGVPLCGGNIDTTVLGRVMDRGLAADERLVQFHATVSDRPGGIAKLTTLLPEQGASIKENYHERAWLHSHYQFYFQTNSANKGETCFTSANYVDKPKAIATTTSAAAGGGPTTASWTVFGMCSCRAVPTLRQ